MLQQQLAHLRRGCKEQPFLLRLPGVERRMVSELAKLGHVLDVLARAPSVRGACAPLSGAQLLSAVRQAETTVRISAASPPHLRRTSFMTRPHLSS